MFHSFLKIILTTNISFTTNTSTQYQCLNVGTVLNDEGIINYRLALRGSFMVGSGAQPQNHAPPPNFLRPDLLRKGYQRSHHILVLQTMGPTAPPKQKWSTTCNHANRSPS